MKDPMLAFIQVQKCMHIILCAKLKEQDQPIDHDAVTLTFRHIISQAAIPEDKKETVGKYIDILRSDQEVRHVFGNAARVKSMMMITTKQITESFQFSMHLRELGLPVENHPEEGIGFDEFFMLADEFEHYTQKFHDIISDDSELMETIRREYEDTSQLKALGTGSGCLVLVIGFVTLLFLVMTLCVIVM